METDDKGYPPSSSMAAVTWQRGGLSRDAGTLGCPKLPNPTRRSAPTPKLLSDSILRGWFRAGGEPDCYPRQDKEVDRRSGYVPVPFERRGDEVHDHGRGEPRKQHLPLPDRLQRGPRRVYEQQSRKPNQSEKAHDASLRPLL